MIGRAAVSAALLLLLTLPGAGEVVAQSSLDRVEELARAGRADEARALLTDWWEHDRDGAPGDDLQEAIWLRGLLTVDPGQASVEFWRLAVEYPGGPYTVRALARIAGGAMASGDTARARRAWEILAREHRRTPEGERASEWLRAPEEPTVAGSTGETAGGFTVQLGAFGTLGRARELMERARSAGFEPRLVRVPGSGLARVRVGRFATRAGAEELRRRLADLGFEALVSVDAAREEPVGGG